MAKENPDNGKNPGMRMGMLLGFAFLTGLGLGPLLFVAIMMNPSLVPSALMLTSAVFACFTGAALFAPDGKYLYLGGTLLSGLSTLLFLGFLNILFRSQLLFQVHLYIGLAIFEMGRGGEERGESEWWRMNKEGRGDWESHKEEEQPKLLGRDSSKVGVGWVYLSRTATQCFGRELSCHAFF